MSILLSAFYPEGIVFVADKNITTTITLQSGTTKYVESTGTKVLSWPNSKAIIGYVGLAKLANLPLEEWIRIFIAETREFDYIGDLAQKLRERIQHDFSNDYQSKEVSDVRLIILLGGFAQKEGVFVPVMYKIWNFTGKVDPKTGDYPPGERIFNLEEVIEKDVPNWPNPEDYPKNFRKRLQNMIDKGNYLWYNNGMNLGAFNVFKKVLWDALNIIKEAGFAAETTGIDARIAFCRMSVELFGLYFTHNYFPEDRAVGGGSDFVCIPWPK